MENLLRNRFPATSSRSIAAPGTCSRPMQAATSESLGEPSTRSQMEHKQSNSLVSGIRPISLRRFPSRNRGPSTRRLASYFSVRRMTSRQLTEDGHIPSSPSYDFVFEMRFSCRQSVALWSCIHRPRFAALLREIVDVFVDARGRVRSGTRAEAEQRLGYRFAAAEHGSPPMKA